MSITLDTRSRAVLLAAAIAIMSMASTHLRADTANCGGASTTIPFVDVSASNIFFCAIAEAYFSGLTFGTTATTYSPSDPVPREQMAAFNTRTLDQSLTRGSRRAALQQWWTPTGAGMLREVDLVSPAFPLRDIVFDGADLWVAVALGPVHRVAASSGRPLQTWTGVPDASAIIACAGRIFVASHQGAGVDGRVYVINPEATSSGAATLFAVLAGGFQPQGLTCDGANLWTANVNNGSGGSLTRINLTTSAIDTFTTGYVAPGDILWDGENLWVVDSNTLRRVNPATGTVLQSIPISVPHKLLFDGANLWVGTGVGGQEVKVFRAVGALRGTLLANLTGNGLEGVPQGMAFDGERVLVTNFISGVVSLWKAADLTPLGNLATGGGNRAACSDGVNFWIIRPALGDIIRF